MIRESWEGRIVDGKYALLEWLGGSGDRGVFLTVLDGIQRAAIKLILAEGADADAFLAQWEAAKTLSNPHLMPVLRTGQCEIAGTHVVYIVTEHAEKVLARFLPEKPLRAHEAKNIFEPVLFALSYLHENGFVHGHIKPSNILVSGGELKISTDDFLVAAGVSKPPRNPGIHDAPEVAAGSLTPAADIWSVGISIIEALTQHPPAWDKSTHSEPIVPESLPQPFPEIVRECLRLDPAQRSTIRDIEARLNTAPPLPVATEPVAASSEQVAAAPRPIGKSKLFEPAPFPSRLFEDVEESTRSRFPLIPVVLGVLVLAFAVFLVMRSNGTNLSALFHRQSAPPASPTASPTQPPQISSNEPQSAPPTSQAAPASQSPSPSAGEPQSPPASNQPAPQPEAAAASPAESQTPSTAAQPESQNPQPAHASIPATTSGAVAARVMPSVSPSARESMHGPVTVVVRVFVDRSGSVSNTAYVTQGPGNYFARISARAAHECKFSPPQTHGRPEPSVWTLRFYFTHGNTEVTETEERR